MGHGGGWADLHLIIFALCSSYMDGGGRFKQIDLASGHSDFVQLPAGFALATRAWFQQHLGSPHDLSGNLHFVIGAVSDNKNKWLCCRAQKERVLIKRQCCLIGLSASSFFVVATAAAGVTPKQPAVV